MNAGITREQAFDLLKKYNQEEFWGIVGLLHDIDFEQYPEQHCIKAPELLREGGASEELIHAVCSHGYAITVDVKSRMLQRSNRKRSRYAWMGII